MSTERPMPGRIVHLHGGLRAFDGGAPKTDVGVSSGLVFGQLNLPSYGSLYAMLAKLGLRPLGVEFLTAPAGLVGASSPDWRSFSFKSGFYAMNEEQIWQGVRHNASTTGQPMVADLAGRCGTYLRLLSIRVREISEAYGRCLNAHVAKKSEIKAGLFTNSWTIYIDAALHGFLADAASFRDLIAEMVWRLVLGQTNPAISTLGGLLRQAPAKDSDIALVKEVLAQTREGGWLRNLSSVRDAIIHVAPLSRSQEFHFVATRLLSMPDATSLPTLHYPLTEADGSVRHRPIEPVDFRDEATIKIALEQYHGFVARSGDALDFAVENFTRLTALAREVRTYCELVSKPVVLTEKEIIGPIKVTRGESG
ncbi:MAG: hypothetical protein ACREEB_17755 [Caulobacteraceae bacterium]